MIGAYYFISVFQPGSGDYTYQQFMKDVKSDKVTAVTIKQNKEVPTGTITAEFGKDDYKSCEVTDVNQAINDIKKADSSLANKISIKGIDHSGDMISNLIGIVLPIGVVIFFMVMMMRQNGGGGGKMMDFGKSRAKLANPNGKKVTFNDVAGLTEEKEELEEVVEFLKNPGRFIKIGARIPKGVLLVGPPGTGKTLLAKAVAGEANVPFFSISGSDFVEMFVGVGAARVRDLFAEAKKHSPCIVFIDEIDAVARRRGSGLGGGHDEREQTLNQMLVEMDGFGVNEGIIMIAATNRVDILDPAILRPGRFDRKVGVGRPDVKGREDILKIHCRQKPLGDDVDLHEIARTTAGFVGADLENLMNEAAIQAARDDRAYIMKEDIDKSFIKVGIGTEKKSRVVPESERRITAYHESGHAILFHLLPDVGPVYTVSIIPTGTGAAGYTMPLPENDNVFMTRGKMIQDIMVSLGGRIAEELILDDITTGASQDIKQVTQYARAMVTKFGMSDELGLINYDSGEGDEVFLGKEIGQQRPYGENTQTVIDQEVKKIVNKCYKDAKAMIEEHIDVLHKCAALLLEKERINRAEFEALFEPETEVETQV
ncbi:cell division protein FtsH [Anaerostipes hadrus]|uniref:ATP-dependent zinc metalloprotease FtsH n=1 Tax=Anaerostipes hadrus TaxID=649756 RepID=A0A1Q2CB75_ANAHA|nr:cell division protein FtsH [Anaerostipes hadrus]